MGSLTRKDNMIKGIVKWFNNEKGYGFIKYLDNEDIFVHYSAIKQDGFKTLEEGQCVEFKLLDTNKGYQAKEVKVIKDII
jgi:CspA family cold shock protein